MAEQQFTQEDLLSNQQSQTLDQLPVEPPVTEPVIPMAEFGKQPTETEKTFKQLISEPEPVTGKLNDKLGLADPLIIAQKDNDFAAIYSDYDNAMSQKNDELTQKLDKKQITKDEYSFQYNEFNKQMRNYLETSRVSIDNYYENLQKSQPEEETRANRLAASLSNIGSNEAANLINEINSLNNMLYGATGESRINFQEQRQEDQEPTAETVSYRQPKELAGTKEGIEMIPDTSAPKMEVNGKIITEDEYRKKAKLTRDAGILTIPAFRKAIKEGELPPDAILETGIYFPHKTVENLENGKVVTSYKSGYEGVGGEPTYVMMDYDPVAKIYKQRFVEVSKAGAEMGGEPQKLAEIVIDPFMDRVRKKDPEALSKIYNSTSDVLVSPEFSDNIKMIALVSAYPKPDEFKQKSEEAFGKRAIEQIAGAMGVSTPSQLFTGGQEILGELQRKIMGRPEADLTPGKFAIDLLKNKPLATEIDRLLKDTQYQRLMKTPEGMSQLVAIAKTNVSNRENLEYINTYGPQLTEMTNTIKRTLEYLDNGTKIINSEANKYRIEIETIKSNSGYNAKMKEADALLQRIEANTDPNYRNVYRALIIINKKNKGEEVSADDLDFMSKVGDKILKDREDLQQVVVDDYNKYKDARVEAINSFPETEIAEYIAKNGSAIQMKADELEQFRRSVADSNVVVNYGKLISRLSQAYDNIDSRTYENISSYFPYLETDPQKVDVSALIPFGSPFSALLGGFKSLLGGAAKTYNYIEGRIGYDEMVGSMESTLRDNKQFLETYRQKTGNFISDVGYQTFEMLPMLYGFSRMANLGATRPFLYSIVIGDGIKKAAEAGLNTTAERVIYSTVLAEAEVLIEKLVPESVYARRAAKPSLTSDLFKRILTPSTRKAGIREYAKIALKGFKKQGVIGLGEYAEEALAEKLTFVVDRLSNDYLNASFTPTESTGRENIELALSMLASTTIMGGTRKLAEMARPTVVDNVNIGKTAKALRKINYLDQAGKATKLDKNESLLLAAISTPTGLYEMTKFVADVEAGNISKYDLDTDMYATLKDKLIPAALGTSIFKDKSLSIEQRAAYIAAHGRRIEIEKAINTGEITPDTAKFQLEQIEEDKQKILKDNEFAKQQFNLTGEDIKNKLYEYFEVSDEVIKSREAKRAAEPAAAEPAATAEGEPIVTPFKPEAATAATAEDIERRRQEELDRSTTANNAVIAADYLFTGGRDVMLSTDYLLQALIGSFPSAGKAIDAIRIKYGSRIGNIKDDVNSQVYQEMMAEIRGAINNTYNNQRVEEIFNKILENPTGFTFREGNAISAELETLNQQQEDKINAKYDAELASLQTIKTQEDATKISERAQQEIPQPSNLVQREGTQEGQPQVGQAEGAVGQATQPAADTRNRNLGSQAQEVTTPVAEPVAEDVKRFINNFELKGNREYPTLDKAKNLVAKLNNAKERLKGLNKNPEETLGLSKNKKGFAYSLNKTKEATEVEIKETQYKIDKFKREITKEAEQNGLSKDDVLKAVEDLIGQPAAPMEEAAPVTEDFFPVERAKPAAEDVSKRKAKLGIMAKANKIEDIDNPRDRVMAHFVSGGNINTNAIQKLLGGKDARIRQGASTESERKARFSLLSANGPTIDGLANILWEQYGLGEFDSYDTRDYRNAIEEVLLDHTSRASMAKELNARYTDAAKSQDLTEEEISMLQEQEMSMLMSIVAGIDEDVKGEILNLLETYTIRKPTGSEIDWRKLEEDSNGFEPAILNLSEKSQNIIDEILKNPKQFATGNISAEGVEQQKQQGEAATEPTAQEPIQGILTADTRIPSNLEKVYNFLDGIDKAISRELGTDKLSDATRVIPLATAQLIVKGLKRLVKGGMSLQKAITEMSKKYKVSEIDAVQALNVIANIENIGGDIVVMSAREYMRDSISNQIRAIGKVKDRAKAIQDAVGKVIDDIKDKFGVDFKLSSSAVKRLNKNLSDAVFSKMDDTTAIEKIVADITPLVEYEVKRSLLGKTSKLIDKVKQLDDKARYTGQAGVLAQQLTELNAGALLNSKATLEDISILNDYLADITGRKINTTNLKDAVDIANKFAPSIKQKAVAGKNAVVDKMQRVIDKIGEGSFDFTDYADLVTAEKAINDFQEQIGDLSDLTDEEFKDVNAKFEELKKALPKPIEQLMEDAKNQIDAELTNQINRLKQAIETSQEFRDSIPNPFFYDELLFLKDALSEELVRLRDNNQGFIASLTPKERMLLSSAIDESFRGNVNSTAYQFSTMVRAFRVFEGAYKFGATIAQKRGLIDADGITNFAKSRIDNFRRIFVDIDYNPSSAKLIASGMSVFKIHMLDIAMNTGSDEFGVGTLEKTIYGPIVNANDKAFNMFSEGLTKLEESKKFLNSKGNQAVIKRGIRRLDQTLGTGLFGNATVFKYIKNRLGWDNTLYFDISNRMVSIVKSQIDYISNLKEGQPLIDRTLTRNILKIKPEEFATRKIKNLQELYKGKPMAITEMTDSREMFDIIAYGILTDGGTKTLEELSIEELTKLLSQDQQKAMMKWTEHIEDTRNLSEAAMVRRGRKPAFLNNYMPIQVVSDKEGVKDIDDYMKSAGNNVGVDSGQLKARSSETGRMNLDGLSVLYNNLKDLYLVHEVKAPLDALKGIDRAIAQLNGEGNLFAATYAQAVQIDTGNRVKEALDANEKIVNDSLKTAYKVAGAVSSFSARTILIANYRQFIKDYPSNVIKLAATLFFANKRFKNQVFQLANPFSKITYKTPKGEYVWEDYVEIAKITGSPAYRTVTMRGDNFLYEFSKSKEQLQREQRLTSWQDMRPRKLAWMSKFEEAFFRLTGEYLDHKAFADPRGAYRAIYNTAVQRASDAADALLDREQGLPSIIRQPLKMQMVPILGRFMRNASGGKWSGLIRKNSIGGLVFSFMAGFPSIINQLFFRHIRTTLSIDKSITLKERTKNAVEALVKVVLPQITYNYMGAIQGILQATIDSAVNAIGGSPEEKKEQYAKFNSLKGWELQVAKMTAVYNEAEEKAINAVINSLFASSVDVGAMNVFRPFAGFIAFKGWQQGAIEALAQKGLTKQEVEERKQSIREIENLLFEGFNIKLIHAFPTEEYRKAILSKYGNKEVDALKDIIKVTGAFGVVLGEADKLFDLTKLMASTDEYEGLSDREIYVAATLKAYSLFFSNIILGGKYGWVFSSFAGDARGVANMLISDEMTKLRSEERAAKKGGGTTRPTGRRGGAISGGRRGGARFP